MPRRHPKPDERPSGASPARQIARRNRRKARREAKSAPLPLGLLTPEERARLTQERAYLRSRIERGSEPAAELLANIERELDADRAAIKRASRRDA